MTPILQQKIEEKMKEVASIFKEWILKVQLGETGYEEAHEKITKILEDIAREAREEERQRILAELEGQRFSNEDITSLHKQKLQELNSFEGYNQGLDDAKLIVSTDT